MNQQKEAVLLKLTKAKLLFAEIDVLMENGFYTTAISRLYYGCFHATKALLLTKNLTPKTHSGTAIILHKNFVLENEFDSSKSSFFSRLMQERIEDDYSDFMISDAEEVIVFIDPARKYLFYVEGLITKYLSDDLD